MTDNILDSLIEIGIEANDIFEQFSAWYLGLKKQYSTHYQGHRVFKNNFNSTHKVGRRPPVFRILYYHGFFLAYDSVSFSEARFNELFEEFIDKEGLK